MPSLKRLKRKGAVERPKVQGATTLNVSAAFPGESYEGGRCDGAMGMFRKASLISRLIRKQPWPQRRTASKMPSIEVYEMAEAVPGIPSLVLLLPGGQERSWMRRHPPSGLGTWPRGEIMAGSRYSCTRERARSSMTLAVM